MITKSTPPLRLLKTSLIAGVFASACAGSAFAAADASIQVYLSRGTETSDSQNIFATVDASGNGLTFTDRFVQTSTTASDGNNLNQVDALNPLLFDKTTGYRTADATTATYVDDGSRYFHMGYTNSGYVGSGTTVQDLILNGNMTLGRMAYENQFSNTIATQNIPAVLTSGSGNYTLTFNCAASSNENMFFRGPQSSHLILDVNVALKNASNNTAGVQQGLVIGNGNTLQLGTASTTRTFTVENTGMRALTSTNRNAFQLTNANSKLICYSNISVNDTATRTLVRMETSNTNGVATFNGDITVKKFMSKATIVVSGKDADVHYRLFETTLAGQVINVNGNVTIEKITDPDIKQDSTSLLGEIKAGSVINYNGKITSVRTAETSLNLGSLNAKAIGNFRGNESNSFAGLGLRHGAVNLLKSGTAKAISFSANSDLGFGSDVAINVFGENQMDLSKAKVVLWSPGGGSTTLVSGTINLNGTSTSIRAYNANNADGRNMIVDFGITKSNMTAEEIAAQGITADMINATGEGSIQTFKITGTAASDISINNVATNTITFKNYIVGEDHVICATQLGARGYYSQTDLNSNLFRFEGFGEYGVDYYVSETSVSGGWEYAVVLIPEPAEFAALFGLAALGFAAYRRRNK